MGKHEEKLLADIEHKIETLENELAQLMKSPKTSELQAKIAEVKKELSKQTNLKDVIEAEMDF